MNEILVFIWIASAITVAVNEFRIFLESSLGYIFPSTLNVKWGIYASLIFSFWGIYSYQTGLLFNIGIEYSNIYFKYFDLTITSLITAGGAAVVYEWIEAIRTSKKTDFSSAFAKKKDNF